MVDSDSQVLTFLLGDEQYCVDIDYVDEIVDGGEITPIPDTDPFVEGVMDLRGKTTTIVNPTKLLDTDATETGGLVTDGGDVQNRVIILDSGTVELDSSMGWVVSDVEEVSDVSDAELETGGAGTTDAIQGLINEDDGFTVWLNPQELTA